jgi:hypothetical protein
MTELGRSKRKNLIVVRVGDNSLHTTFFAGSEIPRSWDLHVSYFGSTEAPSATNGENFTWSADGGHSKFSGLYTCFEKKPSFFDDYDYIAIPDDDIICTKDDWNTAFSLAREYKMAACQLSLNNRSFYSHDITLRRKGFRLRWVTMIEPIAPIIRSDILKRLMPIFSLPDNMWAIDDALTALVVNEPKSLAILDTASVVHTREVMSSSLYGPIRAKGKTPAEIQTEFMLLHSIPRHVRETVGAVDVYGRTVLDLQRASKVRLFPKLLQRYRRKLGIVSIARRELVIFRMTSFVRSFWAKLAPFARQWARDA